MQVCSSHSLQYTAVTTTVYGSGANSQSAGREGRVRATGWGAPPGQLLEWRGRCMEEHYLTLCILLFMMAIYLFGYQFFP